jgi:hypothetical protein
MPASEGFSSSAFVERSSIVIDPSHSFLIMRMRSIKINNIVVNTIYITISNYCNKFTI